MKATQRYSLGNLCQASLADKLVEGRKCPTPMSSSEMAMTTSDSKLDILSRMPDDVLFQILLHCGPYDADESVKLVCRRFQ